ncbi:hypothetical protein FDI23_gp058 [Serratia phage CHI14]|uniref:Uncharacterized protein n=2 Tax=Winklervirus chi14 TaxID=2560752 RepID=A0A1Z1LY56_9CAUD|nr:hypothetical protein FDI23_gp058 [Serratia phage CHI14]ARW57481.1 hypothetical protein [Serratia phage CHI14]ARW57756.1 hypothetical protein [Serratia phage CBH8]UJJ22040.1 hypothetical protein [Erwinia phage Virsaitis27]
MVQVVIAKSDFVNRDGVVYSKEALEKAAENYHRTEKGKRVITEIIVKSAEDVDVFDEYDGF